MNGLVKALALFSGVFALALSGAHAQDERTFNLNGFDRIDVSSGIILVADVGEPHSVIVKTEHGDFSDFEIDVDEGALRISRDHNRLSWHSKKSKYKVMVTAPMLRALEASSGSHAKISNLNARRFVIDLSSGAHASLDGACEDCMVDLSSGAKLDAKSLSCETARIDVSSGGHGEISASRAVLGDASSGGHVTVFGNPQRVSIDKSSGGGIYLASTTSAERD
ncbi:MAG: DUF2807 domain-containing protein [Pseudomonadota bacterium]